MRSLGIALCVSLGACTATDTGNPPFAPALDPARVSGGIGFGIADPVVDIEGAPGSVDPARGEVFAGALERVDAFERADVADDGSFSLDMVRGGDGETVRVWVRDGEAVSAPADLLVDGERVVAAPMTVPGCLVPTPALVVSAGIASEGETVLSEVTLENRCDAPIAISNIALVGGSVFVIEQSFPAELAPGARATHVVRATPSAAGTFIDSTRVTTDSGVLFVTWMVEGR